ncbi:MAG TPA: HD-GYP domain-containing protein [Candidatus Baltobacteraceae bacterium]|nr:HD-GYP domain-containing protein [Candidatus Baltobacteraceae bacterium]
MRFGFVARFAAVLLAVTIGIAAALSYAFAGRHLLAIKGDLIASAAGQASATLQPALMRYAQSGRFTEMDRERIDVAVRSVENFQELVRSVRLYRPDGTPLDPIIAPDASVLVTRAIAEQNIVQSGAHRQGSDSVVTVFVPLASSARPGYLAVAAIDVSLGQLSAQTSRETQFVVLATVFAVAIIFLSLLTLAIAAQRELNFRRRVADTTFLQTMQGIAAIVDQRDPYTAGHSARVSQYAVAIATRMKLNGSDIDRVRWGALLHDLGKIGIPDAVLLKDGPLDPLERNVINQHPTIANAILCEVEAMADIAPCVLHHHERWDGTGYPGGLAAERIPLLSRVIAVADTFDAMTTDRPYRNALAVSEARSRLIAGKNVQWDARCVDAAMALLDEGLLCPPEGAAAPFGQRLAR